MLTPLQAKTLHVSIHLNTDASSLKEVIKVIKEGMYPITEVSKAHYLKQAEARLEALEVIVMLDDIIASQ